MSEAQRKVYDDIVSGPRGAVKGPLLAALYNPELADRWQKLGELLRFRTSIAPRHSEMAILITAGATNCAFEWQAHEPWAVRAGLEPEFIAAIKRSELPSFVDPVDLAVYDFATQLLRTHTVSEDTYARMLTLCGPVATVELTAVVGYYTMVAMTLNAHNITPEDSNPLA